MFRWAMHVRKPRSLPRRHIGSREHAGCGVPPTDRDCQPSLRARSFVLSGCQGSESSLLQPLESLVALCASSHAMRSSPRLISGTSIDPQSEGINSASLYSQGLDILTIPIFESQDLSHLEVGDRRGIYYIWQIALWKSRGRCS